MKHELSIISVFVNLILAIGKVIVGSILKSSAILAEGLHSGMDVFSSIISFFGIHKSQKPVDKTHPYGYYKFEVLSGLIITIFLFLVGIWTIYESIKGFLSPRIISISYLSIGIMLASVILNEIMARLKIHYGKKENSLSLLSDGVHDQVDVYTSIGVLIGLFLMPHWIYVDAILALLIGLYIIKESISLGKEATDSLLDLSAGPEVENKIQEIAKEKNIEITEIKTQKKGSIITANLEIKLASNFSVDSATKIVNEFKENLSKNIDKLNYVAIQIESHKIESNYFKSGFNLHKNLEWSRKGRYVNTIQKAKGFGPGGKCVCSKCGYMLEHKKGNPCAKLSCPNCNKPLTRK